MARRARSTGKPVIWKAERAEGAGLVHAMSDSARLEAIEPAPRSRAGMTFAIVNGQRVPVDDSADAGGDLVSKDPHAGGWTAPASAAAPAGEGDGFLEHYWNQVNPVPLGQLLPFPQALGGSGMHGEGIRGAASNLLKAQGAVFDKAREAYDKGDHVGAAIHALYWLLPVLGPVLDKAGNELREGKTAASMGDTLGLSTALFGPEALSRAAARPTPGMGTTTPPRPPRLSPEDLASNAFADERGIPLTAADRTGSTAVRQVQKITGESFLGEQHARATKADQVAGLTRVGNEIADTVKPGAVSPEEGGAGARQSITETIESLKNSANVQYGKVREIEALPEHTETVHTAPRGSASYRQILAKLEGGISGEGGVRIRLKPTDPELYTMRQIEAELDAQPYQRGRLVQEDVDRSDTHYARGSANADVYHEIQQAAGTDAMTGARCRPASRDARNRRVERGELCGVQGRAGARPGRRRGHRQGAAAPGRCADPRARGEGAAPGQRRRGEGISRAVVRRAQTRERRRAAPGRSRAGVPGGRAAGERAGRGGILHGRRGALLAPQAGADRRSAVPLAGARRRVARGRGARQSDPGEGGGGTGAPARARGGPRGDAHQVRRRRGARASSRTSPCRRSTS
jgi:hypothetical protein